MDAKVIGLGVIIVALLGTIAVASTGSIPAPPGMGQQVADVVVYVSGTWQNYDIPFISDTASISQITYSVTNYHDVLYSVSGTIGGNQALSTADTAQAKIEYKLMANGETQAQGTVQMSLSANWETQFTIQNVPPGTYTLYIALYEYWNNGIAGSGWAARASSSTSITINPE
jgi:hypothetical protein